jgi:pimeloyl-ACP methyl ester carboxylesterase
VVPVLAQERLPADGPRVVLLHAGVADRRTWRDIAPALHARGADVLAYDRRGFGETPASPEPFRHVDDLLDLLDAPAWLVGNSQGGAIALDATLLAPDRIAGLVLIAPAVSGAPEPPDDVLDRHTARLVQAIMAAEEAGDIEALNRHEIHLWLDGPSSPEGRVGGPARELALDMNRIALESGAAEDAGASGVDAWSRLEEIEAPATIVWGDLDVPELVVACRELERRLRDVRAAIQLSGVAHLPMLERPDELTTVIAEAIGQSPRSHANE